MQDRTGHVGFAFCKEKYITHCLASYGGHWGEVEIKVGSTVLILTMDPGRYSPNSGIVTVLLPTGRVGYMFGHEIKTP